MGETRPGERMRRGSMSPPRPTSLDEVGEPWKDGADGDLGGTFRPAAAAAEGGSGRRSGLSGAPAKEQHQARGPCAASAAAPPLPARAPCHVRRHVCAATRRGRERDLEPGCWWWSAALGFGWGGGGGGGRGSRHGGLGGEREATDLRSEESSQCAFV